MAYAKSLIRRELLSFLLEARSFDEELAAAIAAQTEAKPKRRFTQLKIRHGHGQGQAPDKGSPASRYSSVTMSKLAKSTAGAAAKVQAKRRKTRIQCRVTHGRNRCFKESRVKPNSITEIDDELSQQTGNKPATGSVKSGNK
ncbi:hypothetical protein CC1G_06071 [Coprinopsis cinerea okayama7|uniref:Uncharacterized protein n=1 Tax=Coprinopsis cinerea (strain Okayama-7 / 130 / ATCC MYA-4618 / FGSC 9003) TaxID=240176 RepID=A8PA16_COPC7|nr:hypothetical protein CC1G_06071 [Coprinopsis cinerea okayama7\|eukprot:XP_001839881.2 hypothetical protein CC1G_06071 [Coprinopsis cinerea okayama7\